MITAEQARPLVETRVHVAFGKEHLYGILRAVTPAGRLIVAGERGVETLLELQDVKLIEDARHTCTVCGDRVNRVFSQDSRCADCERRAAATEPKPSEICEECGSLGAFYSPKAKRFRCTNCHAAAGSLTGIGPELRAMTHASREAPCRTADIDSLIHNWKRSKSSYICRLCYVRVHEKPAGYVGG